MKIKHTLASIKDQKATILNSEMKKLIGDYECNDVTLYYHEWNIPIKFHKSRNGKTWYAESKFPNKENLPEIGNPKIYDVYTHLTKPKQNFDFELIRKWAKERGIYEKGDPKTQLLKLIEEVGELSKAILKNDENEFIDAIGDCVVVLTNLSKLKGYDIEECINSAYKVISKRSGSMINGTFVKDGI